MNTYEIIKELTKRKKMSIRQLEITLGYSNGYFSKWKKVSPNSEGLQKVADYFNVSVDYLLGRTDNTKATDEKNSDDLDDVLDNVMSFDG
ncbi:helix-turn-helix transcriptional regulator, partial [Enterococcus faecalis]|uniref:helix-turn-helix domain-containing protein n=2 Tax=Enterococcus TaxID=1350 RepID=UPI003D6B95C4